MDSQSTEGLPEPVSRALAGFAGAVSGAFGDHLRCLILYGSAAEGRLRATSDVNVLILLSEFDPARAERLRDQIRVAQAAIRLRAMFLLESELPASVEAFSVKFEDIMRRHRVLIGADPFSRVVVPRAASIARLRQILLNLMLRLREAYVSRGLREEQLCAAIAEATGPLRVCAATLLELGGERAGSPKEALCLVAGPGSQELLSRLTDLRSDAKLPPGVAGPVLLGLIDLIGAMRRRADSLS